MAENGLGITICAGLPGDDKPAQVLAHDSLTKPPQTYETAARTSTGRSRICPAKFEGADALEIFTLEEDPRTG
jgi:hypothetical protein